MGRIITISIVFLALSLHAETVYVCTGPKAKRYHNDEWCIGLGSCSKTVVAMERAAAEKKGKTPCKVCYEGKGPGMSVKRAVAKKNKKRK